MIPPGCINIICGHSSPSSHIFTCSVLMRTMEGTLSKDPSDAANMLCPKCPENMALVSNKDTVRSWYKAIKESHCVICQLFISTAIDDATVTDFQRRAGMLFVPLTLQIPYLGLEIRTCDFPHGGVHIYTNDDQVNDEFRRIKKANYTIDASFFRGGLEGAKTWLERCRQSHSLCGGPDAKFVLPTRLVAVGSAAQNPYLYIPVPGEKGVYATLSYCWGKCTPFTTTKENVGVRVEGFLLSELPKTCRDAVLTARLLNIPFIWIDQLCIIQDDSDDWEREAGRMHAVYANSILTLAALTSPGADAGFQTWDDEPTKVARGNAAAEIQLNGRKAAVYVRRQNLYTTRVKVVHETESGFGCVLESRLWTLQEVALSPRLLWFTNGDIGWSCKESVACDCEPTFTPATRHELPPHLATNLSPTSMTSQHSSEGWLNIWFGYTKEATRRQVTRQTDRLPAVAGLAAAMQPHIGGRYLAGHWKTNIEKSLLWEFTEEIKFSHQENINHAGLVGFSKGQVETIFRPLMDQDYAPSWSWASVSSPVSNPMEKITASPPIEMDSKVLDIDFRPSTTNEYGPGGGILTMEGVLLPVKPRTGELPSDFSFEPRDGGKKFLLGTTWNLEPRGSPSPVDERDLYLANHLRWPLDKGAGATTLCLVLERVDRKDFAMWEARFASYKTRGPDANGRDDGSNNVQVDDVGKKHCEPEGPEAEQSRDNVFKRIGCVTCILDYDAMTWEQLVEEFTTTFRII
ncbi:HET-domain-containing protein [Bimuria novae-zelandiae CBS 107.79]|uniref:HET-domain-containing protein n=1 Tax=Bimuria novae-zelandiae CBS 107.79 TaxID=1447943 RepID=A0A6A5VI70_9PLEO|nr:HET-domain-containing protein [Bimuria novae-zelandiae CBS 107.79]